MLLLIVALAPASSGFTVESGGWELKGDLVLPEAEGPVAAVLMLNQAGGDRMVYEALAADLAARGIASLALDLRGHGESTNAGQFFPGENADLDLIWAADADVTAAVEALRSNGTVDPARICIVGASYSAEEAAESARAIGAPAGFVAISPGSLSERTVRGIDQRQVPWLFVSAREDRFMASHLVAIQDLSRAAELMLLPGNIHGTDLLDARPDLAPRIGEWIALVVGD